MTEIHQTISLFGVFFVHGIVYDNAINQTEEVTVC